MSQQENSQATIPPTEEHLYEYESLPEGPFTRYLVLQPTHKDSEPLVCTLHTTHLDEIPRFEAISYVWGQSTKNQRITCDDKTLYITPNLSEALHQVRRSGMSRTLWADSICINQADAQERGQQISIMGAIYNKSTCTLICLGRSESDHIHAQAVSGLVAEVDDMIQRVLRSKDFKWDFSAFPLPVDREPLLSHKGWASFRVLLQQPWFRRGWVVQEAVLAREALVLWANAEIAWLKLLLAYIWYVRRALRLPHPEHDLWLPELHLQSFFTSGFREAITFQPGDAVLSLSLLEILESARGLGLSDPRDRIYAFIDLPSSTTMLPALRPDYGVPYLQVYCDFACAYVRSSQDLDILHFVHNNEDALTEAANSPSWVPRWNISLYSNYTGMLNNYTRHTPRIIAHPSLSPHSITVSPDQTTLALRAVVIGTVRFTGPGFNRDTTTPEDVILLWEVMATMPPTPESPPPPPYSCSRLRAFVEIFRCGIYHGRLEEWKILESAYMQLLQRELSPSDAILYNTAVHFHKERMEDVHNKSFIVSDRGYYGLAPSAVREGDVCCIIYGTRAPFILRKTGRGAGNYKLVGSMLMLSTTLDHNGHPTRMAGGRKGDQDWVEWGLEDEDTFLC